LYKQPFVPLVQCVPERSKLQRHRTNVRERISLCRPGGKEVVRLETGMGF
jgi:hypothetical protein